MKFDFKRQAFKACFFSQLRKQQKKEAMLPDRELLLHNEYDGNKMQDTG